jgi:hypothetical protein
MNTAIESDAREIRALIRNAEAAGDEFMAAMAKLKIKIVNARAHPDVVPHEAQAALLRLASAERQALSSSTSLFRVHNELSDIAIRMDVEHITDPLKPAGFLETEWDAAEA